MIEGLRWAAIPLCLFSGAVHAEPRLFSSGGGMGSYYHSFLVSKEATGLEENQFVNVRTINNSGQVADAEWMVNCNESYPQAVDPNGESIQLSLTEDPPSATQTVHELWWAACRGKFEKYSAGLLRAPNLQVGATDSITITAGRKMAFKVLPPGEAGLVKSLARIRFLEGRSGKGQEIAFVYCSDSIPTVSWPDKLVELEVVDDPGRYDRVTAQASKALYRVLCIKSDRRLNAGNGVEQKSVEIKRAGSSTKPVPKSSAKKETSSVLRQEPKNSDLSPKEAALAAMRNFNSCIDNRVDEVALGVGITELESASTEIVSQCSDLLKAYYDAVVESEGKMVADFGMSAVIGNLGLKITQKIIYIQEKQKNR